MIKQRLSHSYYDITRIKDDKEKLLNFILFKGVFIDLKNVQEKVPSVVEEFKRREDPNRNFEEKILSFVKKLENKEVSQSQFREKILSMVTEFERKDVSEEKEEINNSNRTFEDKKHSVVKEFENREISVVTEFERKDVSEEKEEIKIPKENWKSRFLGRMFQKKSKR